MDADITALLIATAIFGAYFGLLIGLIIGQARIDRLMKYIDGLPDKDTVRRAIKDGMKQG